MPDMPTVSDRCAYCGEYVTDTWIEEPAEWDDEPVRIVVEDAQ